MVVVDPGVGTERSVIQTNKINEIEIVVGSEIIKGASGKLCGYG